jgi:hypothetical protein
MPRRVLETIRVAIRDAAYDMTAHALEELAEDELDVIDLETAILTGRLIRTEKDDPRGTRYTVHGMAADGTTHVAAVGRFTETGRYLIITAYKVAE